MITHQEGLQHIQKVLREDHNNLKQLLCGDKIVVAHHNSNILRALHGFQNEIDRWFISP